MKYMLHVKVFYLILKVPKNLIVQSTPDVKVSV